MTTVKTLDRPNFRIGNTTYADAEIWDWLVNVNFWSEKNPLLTSLGRQVQTGWKSYNQSFGQEVYGTVDAYHQPRLGPVDPRAGFDVTDGAYIYVSMKGQWVGYGNMEDYFALIHTRGTKHMFLRVRGDTLTLETEITGGFSIAKDFLPGAALVIALAATAHFGGALVSDYLAAGAIDASAFVGPIETSVISVVEAAPAFVGPVETALVSVVEATPAFVGPIEAVSSGFTFESVLAGTKTAAETVVGVSKGIVQLTQTAAVIQAAVSAGTGGDPPAPAPAPADSPSTSTNTIMYAGALVLLLLLKG